MDLTDGVKGRQQYWLKFEASADALKAPPENVNPVPGERAARSSTPILALAPIILGKDLAQDLGATVGSVVMVSSPQGELTPFGIDPKFVRFKVVGIFQSGLPDYDAAWAVTRLTDATRQQEAVRARLSEASDEIQLALMALGDPVSDPATVVADAVHEVITLEDTVSSE